MPQRMINQSLGISINLIEYYHDGDSKIKTHLDNYRGMLCRFLEIMGEALSHYRQYGAIIQVSQGAISTTDLDNV